MYKTHCNILCEVKLYSSIYNHIASSRMYPYLVVFLKFTCTIILRFLYDHLERNEENVDLHRDVKVTFVSSVFLQMDTDIIGSVLFTIRRSLMSCMLRMLFRVRRTLFYVNLIEWHNYVKYLNVKLIYLVYVQHCIGILAVVFQLYSVYTNVHHKYMFFCFISSKVVPFYQ